jgi:hypothetical protein
MDIKKPIANASRTVGGIIKGGEKFVSNIYRNLGDSVYKKSGISNPAKTPKRQVN